VQVVKRGKDRTAQPFYKAHDLNLVADIQMCGRFVEEEDLRPLRKRPREQNAPTLAA
jgi:hypothetical protein